MGRTRILGRKVVLEIKPIPPFAFDATMYKPDHFPSQDTDWIKGCRWQTMLFSPPKPSAKEGAQAQCLGLKFINAGTFKRPKIKLEVYSEDKLGADYVDSLIDEINYRYDFCADYSDFVRKFKNDSQLGPILKKWPGARVVSPQSLYEYLVVGIVLQNCTVRRSVSMMQTLFENYGTPVRYDARNFYCFWEPAVLNRVSEKELRALKVGYRARFLRRISESFASGQIDELVLRTKDKEAQRKALIGLYGIGPATVGYILFDVFKHYDELNHISPWEQKIYSKLFFGRDPTSPAPVKELLKFLDRRFGQYRMLAIHYIWEDLWWRRKHKPEPWLEELVRL